MLKKVELIMSDLMSKVGAFAHPACNGNARAETGPLACFGLLIACTKFDIFRYSCKLRK
jgi:hypothetical protein